jgi:hypothetical protein
MKRRYVKTKELAEQASTLEILQPCCGLSLNSNFWSLQVSGWARMVSRIVFFSGVSRSTAYIFALIGEKVLLGGRKVLVLALHPSLKPLFLRVSEVP